MHRWYDCLSGSYAGERKERKPEHQNNGCEVTTRWRWQRVARTQTMAAPGIRLNEIRSRQNKREMKRSAQHELTHRVGLDLLLLLDLAHELLRLLVLARHDVRNAEVRQHDRRHLQDLSSERQKNAQARRGVRTDQTLKPASVVSRNTGAAKQFSETARCSRAGTGRGSEKTRRIEGVVAKQIGSRSRPASSRRARST
jgi:hypothetical protein